MQQDEAPIRFCRYDIQIHPHFVISEEIEFAMLQKHYDIPILRNRFCDIT